jgi:hypothetical protein
MEWSERVEERHDFTASELDPSRRGGRSGEAPAGDVEEDDGATAADDLFGRMQSVMLSRRFEATARLRRVWGDDLFVTHLMQLIEPADWLDAETSRVAEDGVSRMVPCCDRFSFRDPEALRGRLLDWWRRGPLYVDHPRRRAVVRPEPEPARVAKVPEEEVERVAAAITEYGAKRLPFEAARALVAAWTGPGQAPPREVAGRWIAALSGTAARGSVTAEDALGEVLAAVESRWATFLAPLVQAVFGDDRFVAGASRRFYAHHWLASAAPMRFDDPEAAEAAITAWWKGHGVRHRAAMVKVLPVESLLEDALAESRATSNAASPLQDPALVYLREDPATVRAILQALAAAHAASTATEVPYFLHRFGLDVDGLFELVVNRCDASWPPALIEVLEAALRVRSPRVVRHLAPLIRRKGARPLIEHYLLNEGANAIDGLLDMVDAGAKPRAFALGWLPQIAGEERGRRTIAALAATKGEAVRRHVAPLLGGPSTG